MRIKILSTAVSAAPRQTRSPGSCALSPCISEIAIAGPEIPCREAHAPAFRKWQPRGRSPIAMTPRAPFRGLPGTMGQVLLDEFHKRHIPGGEIFEVRVVLLRGGPGSAPCRVVCLEAIGILLGGVNG